MRCRSGASGSFVESAARARLEAAGDARRAAPRRRVALTRVDGERWTPRPTPSSSPAAAQGDPAAGTRSSSASARYVHAIVDAGVYRLRRARRRGRVPGGLRAGLRAARHAARRRRAPPVDRPADAELLPSTRCAAQARASPSPSTLRGAPTRAIARLDEALTRPGGARQALAGVPRDPRPLLLPRRELPDDRRRARAPGRARSRAGSHAVSAAREMCSSREEIRRLPRRVDR